MHTGDLQIIPLKNNILVDWKKQEIKSKIITRINELNIPIPAYRNDNEFLALICNLCEFLVAKKDYIDKKEIVISVYNVLFNIFVVCSSKVFINEFLFILFIFNIMGTLRSCIYVSRNI